MQLTSLTVNGTLRGVSNYVPINIQTTGSITVGPGGTVGGSATSNSHNQVGLVAGDSLTVNGTVRGENGAVGMQAGGPINVGATGLVQSVNRTVNIVSTGGPVSVAGGGVVIAQGNVGVQAGPHQPTQVDGLVRSNNGNVYVNGAMPQSQAGNVTVGAGGSIEAPNGEVKIKADTLRVAGTIKGKTVQKFCKVVIIEPGGSIQGKGSEKNKVPVAQKVEPREDPAQPAEQAKNTRVTGSDHCVLDYSGAGGTVLQGEESVRVAGGPFGVLDLRGNPPGTPVISCPGIIEVFADEILLDPGVLLPDLCGPGPVLSGPSRPVFDVATLCVQDTVGYAGQQGQVTFQVTNMGNMPESFTISVFDSLGWLLGPVGPIVLLGSVDDPVDTLITCPFEVPPWAQPDVDTNRLRLTATSTTQPWESYTESARIPVVDIAELKDLNIAAWGIDGGSAEDTVRVEHWITNNGRLDDDYDLTVWDRDGWGVLPYDHLLHLAAKADSIWASRLIVPPGIPDGVVNEVYIKGYSLSSPTVTCTDTVTVRVGAITGAPPLAPAGLGIRHRSHPNPFNPRVTIEFSLPAPGATATVTVYDALGGRVRELFNGRLEGRDGLATWDGLDRSGRPVASGVYFYRIACAGQLASGKLILAR